MGKPALVLSLTSHTDPMENTRQKAIGLLILLVSAVAAWAAVIVVALQVSSTVLNTLRMIVDLAAMS